jgi:hypothetical protein
MNIFEPELIAVMKAALTQAAAELRASPSTQAFMAERILQTAATGVSSPEELKSVAMQAGGPAASTGNHKSVLQPILRDGRFAASSG